MKRSLLGLSLLVGLSTQLGCEEEKPKVEAKPLEAKQAEEPAPQPEVQSPPHLTITESGPSVRGSSVMLTHENGNEVPGGRAKLKQYLSEEKKFIDGQEVHLVIDRKAKPSWVSAYLTELGELNPSKVLITTETRSEYPKEIAFVPQAQLGKLDPCTLVGTITADRGTAIWKISGGTARKRGRGMGGPDLTMTQDTIKDMKKKCDSDIFFVTGPADVEWGLVYDLAGAGMSLEGAGLKRAALPQEATAGHAIKY